MVAVELAGGVIVFKGHVGQGLVTVAECTVTNLTFVQVGQSMVMVVVSVELGEVTVAGVLDSVIVEFDPGILIIGQVGQGLYFISVEPSPEVVTGG